ncbi:MAG: hypothetical protein ACNS62_24155 [Candidatus Cyclobacteriaceae bacterium M3_2C_046]
MIKKLRFLIFFALILSMAFFVLKPVPIPSEEECLAATGTVFVIREGGEKDIFIRLNERDELFYVNRGLERGLQLNKLRETLINQKVTLKFPNYWTPLDPGNSVRHISKIEINGETVYSEFKN